MITYTNAFSISAFGLHMDKMSMLPQQKGLEFLRGGVSARPKQLKEIAGYGVFSVWKVWIFSGTTH